MQTNKNPNSALNHLASRSWAGVICGSCLVSPSTELSRGMIMALRYEERSFVQIGGGNQI
jgi:hypothetical protein